MVRIRDKVFVRFVVVGGLCFSTNLGVLYVGTDIFRWHYLASMLASILIANSLGWFLNRRCTFSGSRFSWWVEYLRYMSVSLSSMVISLLLMILCVSVLGWHYLLSSAAIALAMLVINFVAHRDWSFSPPKA